MDVEPRHLRTFLARTQRRRRLALLRWLADRPLEVVTAGLVLGFLFLVAALISLGVTK
jgi:hypothetical protein